MRILFVGDVVGRTGRTAISDHLPGMIRDWSLDLVVVNGENSAGGFGITEAIYQECIAAQTELLGIEHEDTLSSMDSLAVLFDAQQKARQGVALKLKISRLRKGDTHVQVCHVGVVNFYCVHRCGGVVF